MKRFSFGRTIVICLICVVLLSVTACQQVVTTPNAQQPEPAEPATEQPAPAKAKVIGFANYSLGNPYCATMAEGATARAKELGFEINIVDNKVDALNQLTAIEDFITLGVDGILILPVDAASIENAVIKAKSLGIPVIANSIPVENADIYVSADNYEMGYNIGKATADWLNANNGGVGKVAYLNAPSLPTIIDRENGFKDAIAKLSPGAEIVMIVPGGSPEEALQSAETVLQAHPDISAIVGYNDSSALGAVNAVEAANIDPTKIFVGGVDATPEAIAKIKENAHYKATVDNIPYENGRLLVDLLVRLWAGEKIDYKYVLPTKIVDQTNIADY